MSFSMRMGMGLGAATSVSNQVAGGEAMDYTSPEILDTITGAGELWQVDATLLTFAERKTLQDAALADYMDTPWADDANCYSEVIGRDVTDTYNIHGYVFTPTGYTRTALITGNVHGDEKLASAGVLLLMQQLSNPDTSNPVLHKLRGYRLLIIPIVNPNGYVAGTRNNKLTDGVNINRNFDYNWAATPATQKPGSAPGSEAETQAILTWVATFEGEIDWALDVHDWTTVVEDGAVDDTILYAPAFNYNSPYENMLMGYLAQLVNEYDDTGYYITTNYQRMFFGQLSNGLQETLGIPGFNMENRRRTFISAPAGWQTNDELVTRVYEGQLNAFKVLDYLTPTRAAHDRDPYYSPFLCPSLDSEVLGCATFSYADMVALNVDAAEAYTYNNGVDDISVKKVVRGAGTDKILIVGVGADYQDYMTIHRAITELDKYAATLDWLADLLTNATVTFIPTANPEASTIADWAAGADAEAAALRTHITAAGYDYVLAITTATHSTWVPTKVGFNSADYPPAILTDPAIVVGAPIATELTAAGGATIYLNNWGWLGVYYNIRYNMSAQYGDRNFAILIKKHVGAILNAAAAYSAETAYDGRVATPDIQYNGTTGVTITCATAEATIHYTTNGSAPTATSATYTTPLTITAGQVVKALAVKADYLDSAIASIDTTLANAETTAYAARVAAAEGSVIDAKAIDERISYLKAAGLFDNLLAEWSARYGVKVVEDTGVDYVDTLYSLVAGAAENLRDAVQGTTANRPAYANGFAKWDRGATTAQLGNDLLVCGTDYAISAGVTLTAWIKPTPNVTASSSTRLVSREACWGSLMEYNATNRYIRLFGSGLDQRLGDAPQAYIEEWQHVAVTLAYNAGTGKITATAYINGETRNVPYSMTGTIANTAETPVTLGNRADKARGFYGYLDAAAIYDLALTDQQIRADYAATKSRYGL
jgi:hypothetical protein